MPVDPSKIDSVAAAAAKRFGGHQTIFKGSETPSVKRISWGSIEMDMATWGGAPMGRMIRPWGAKSSCKTLCQWNLIAQCQQYRDDQFPNGLMCIYYDVEGTFDPDFVRRFGVDTENNFRVIREHVNIIEEIGYQITEGLMDVGHVHIIDTASYAMARQEFDSPADKYAPRGARARAWGEVLRRIEEQKTDEHMIVLVDQVRVNQATGSEMSAGSTVFDHASSMDLHHRRIKSLYRQADGSLDETYPRKPNYDTLTGEVLVDGHIIGVEINKSKVSRPFGKARLILDLDTLKFDRISEIIKVGIYLGVIEKSGSWFKVPGVKAAFQGMPKLAEYVKNDPLLAMAVYQAKDDFFYSEALRHAA